MKFIVSANHLYKNIQMVNGVISTHTVLPILENLLFELKDNLLTITATDLETTISTDLEVESEVDGEICVPAKTLAEYLSKVPEQPLNFMVIEKNIIQITSNNGNYQLMGFETEDYPKDLSKNSEELTSLIKTSTNNLTAAINFTQSAISTDNARPAMCGIYFEYDDKGINVIATDSHRLAFYHHDSATGESLTEGAKNSFIMSRKPIQSLKNIIQTLNEDLEILYSTKFSYIKGKFFRISTRLIEGKFPDYRAVFPTKIKSVLSIERLELLNSLKRVIVFSNKSSNLIKCSLTNNSLDLETEDNDYNNSGQEKLNCTYNGEDITIGVSGKKLIEDLSAFKSQFVDFQLFTDSKGIVVRPSEDAPKEEDAVGEEQWVLMMPFMSS